MPPVDWSLWHNIHHGPISLRPFNPELHTWQPVSPEAWGLFPDVDRALTSGRDKARNHAPLTEGEP